MMADSSLPGEHEKDIERNDGDSDKKRRPLDVGSIEPDLEEGYTANPRTKEIQNKFAPLRMMVKGEEWLDAKLGIETQGIDLIKEEDKRPPHMINSFLMWWSMTCHVGTLPLGLLGPQIFFLSLGQSVAAIVAGTFLGALCTAFCGTLGPKLGLRAIATSRYSFGFWGAKLCSVLNVVVGCGFAIVNVVVCGQLLSAVSDFKMTISVGCVIITVLSYVISIFGFHLIHTFEKYSWIAGFILLCVMIGQAAPHVDPSIPGDTGLDLAGSFLSFMAICFSSSSGWCSIAADYYCNYPANTKRWKIFMNTLWGVTLPTAFVTIIGACIGNAAFSAEYKPYLDAYDNAGLGGIIGAVYHPSGWSKFALVILTFSVLGNNIAIFYSSGLSLQLLGHWFHAIPRFIWSLAVAVVIGVLAVAGKDSLSAVVNDFVSLLGYWTISFTFVLLIEDQFFRRREGYKLAAWDRPGQLPWGIAAVFALLAGYLAGGVTGMAQTWYVGPIALYFGIHGGDVGIILSGVITIVTYIPARFLERKYIGR